MITRQNQIIETIMDDLEDHIATSPERLAACSMQAVRLVRKALEMGRQDRPAVAPMIVVSPVL